MQKEILRIALFQLDLIWESPNDNRLNIEKHLSELESAVDLVVLPEAFSTGFSMNAEKVAEHEDGETLQWMRHLAKQNEFAICGSLFIKEEGKYYNRFYWVQADGETISYNKRHLFSYGGEHEIYSPGTDQVIIDYLGWRIMPQICYDLRFPVWSRNYINYDILLNVANWPAARAEVWRTLLKARALENQSYVIAVNRIGCDANNIPHSGDSLVFDARGKTLLDAKNEEAVFLVELSKQNLVDFKNKFNTLNDMDSFAFIN